MPRGSWSTVKHRPLVSQSAIASCKRGWIEIGDAARGRRAGAEHRHWNSIVLEVPAQLAREVLQAALPRRQPDAGNLS